MKEKKISKEEIQKKILDLLNFRLIGILISIYKPKNESIIHSELGGNLFLFNVSIIGEPCNYKKLEIHINKEGKLLLQLLDDDSIAESPYWYDYFKSIKDLEKKIDKVKKMLKAA